MVQRAMRGQTPEAVMAELGFGPLLLIKAFPVNMSGGWVDGVGGGRGAGVCGWVCMRGLAFTQSQS